MAACDPLTGARLDPEDRLATDAYRPGAELVALVRARDGRCRFPGCSVAARFCDLDHVRPWPIGPTAARNLLCLCRRHHRIKQRPGWRVRLAPDGTATWTEAAGRVRTTEPLDALDSLVLLVDRHDDMAGHRGLPSPRGVGAPDRMGPPLTPHTQGPPWSVLETHHEFWIEHRGSRDALDQPGHRRCTSSVQLRAACGRRRPTPEPFPDVPPF